MFFEAKPVPTVAGRKPVRTGVWHGEADGGLSLRERDGTLYRIRPVVGRWRLSAGADGSYVHARGGEAYEADNREDCLEMAAFMREHARAKAEWCSRPAARIRRPSHLPGVDLHGERDGASIRAHAIDTATGVQLGDFLGGYVNWRAAWVLGEPAVTCGSSLPEHLIGTGLGRALYDIVEEIAGLPLVPQGRNHVGGGLNHHSDRFWARRAAHVRVPGLGDPAVEARCAAMDRIESALRIEGRRLEPEMIVALAARIGMPVEMVVSDTAAGPLPCFAWCIAPDGRAVTTWGLEERDDVAAVAVSKGRLSSPRYVRGEASDLAGLIGAHRAAQDPGREASFAPMADDVVQAEALAVRHGLDQLGVGERPTFSR